MKPNNYQNLSKLGNVTTPWGGQTAYEGFHAGVDIANAKGTPIPAFAQGVVTAVQTGAKHGDDGYGNRVQVKDSQGNVHQYAHLNQPMVKPGQIVNKGQEIGTMGETGSSYSPTGGDSSHLDYRIMNSQGQYQDPTPVASSALGGSIIGGTGGPGESEMKHKDGKTRIILVRHGTTGLNSQGRLRGWTDVPLNEQGEKEVDDLGKSLKNVKIDGIVTSDLHRAQQTAEAIAKHTGAPVIEVTNQLRPWHLGDLAGKKIEETLPVIKEFASHKEDAPVPGGESFNTFKNRFISKIKDIKDNNEGKTIAVVAHHRNDRLMAAWEKKGMPDDLGIDIKTFLQKGIDPAKARAIVIDKKANKVDGLAAKFSFAHNKMKHPLTYLKSFNKTKHGR